MIKVTPDEIEETNSLETADDTDGWNTAVKDENDTERSVFS